MLQCANVKYQWHLMTVVMQLVCFVVRTGMSSAGNSAGMAPPYQHLPNSSGANSSSSMAASAGMHGIGNSPGT